MNILLIETLELSHYNDFISPFLIACATRNAKYSATAVQCLHTLINYEGLPPSRLEEVLDALKEATHLGVEIQLKILQSLPSLIQNYSIHLSNQLIVELLLICHILQGGNKISVVVNTALATLQQLIIAVFDKVLAEDQSQEPLPKTFEVSADENDKILVSPAAYDALRVFFDICNLIEHQKPLFLEFNHLPETVGLELIESILTTHSDIFITHLEFCYVLRTRAVPLLLRAFSEKRDFPVTVRVTRILYLLIRRQLSTLVVECEVILSLLTHMLDPNSASYWKRVLCMEVFQGVCSEFQLITEIYSLYDFKDGRRAVVKSWATALNNLINEKPEVLLHGTLNEEGDEITPGLSTKRSTVRSSCIDLLDKTDAPVLPQTYLYYLAMQCISSLSEGLARAVVQTNKKEDEKLMIITTSFIGVCWPEFLDSYITFFQASIDSDLYHNLVRSAQKFTHASGILGIEGARDSFLAMLGKFSVNQTESAQNSSSSNLSSSQAKPSLLSMETLVSVAHNRSLSINGAATTPSSHSHAQTGLSSRNILCLRALINLGISLGSSLGQGWMIVLETVLYANYLARKGNSVTTKGDIQSYNIDTSSLPFSGLGNEYQTVENSVRRLVDSSKEYNSVSYQELTQSVTELASVVLNLKEESDIVLRIEVGSIGKLDNCDPIFMLDLVGSIFSRNISRLVGLDSTEFETWAIETGFLMDVITARHINPDFRIRAAQILNEMVKKSSITAPENNDVQLQVLRTLNKQVNRVIKLGLPEDGSTTQLSTECKLHVMIIDYLNKILDQCGGNLQQGWDIVFDITDTVFTWLPSNTELHNKKALVERSIQLVRSGFDTLQLICNDFLENLPSTCLIRLVDTLYRFCHQEGDLNISFTSISFFWIVTDHLRSLLNENSRVDLSKEVVTKQSLLEMSLSSNKNDSLNALWMIALLRLAAIAYDPRPQVRNGAVQILFRIFEAHGSQLPPRVWKACQTIVLETVMSHDPYTPSENQTDIVLNGQQEEEWGETLGLVFSGLGTLYSTFVSQFLAEDHFEDQWNILLNHFQKFSSPERLGISLSVYKSLYTMLESVSKQGINLPRPCIDRTWEFWFSQKIIPSFTSPKAAQEAYTAFVDLHEVLSSVTKEFSAERITKIVDVLRKCSKYPLLAPYSSDKDHLSTLQSASLEQIKLINLNTMHNVEQILHLLAELSTMAFEDSVIANQGEEHLKNKKTKEPYKYPSFVALSINALEHLEYVLKQASIFPNVFFEGTGSFICDCLLVPMNAKFNCSIIGGGKPQLWQLATTRFIELSKLVISNFSKTEKDTKYEKETEKLWSCFGNAVSAILLPGKDLTQGPSESYSNNHQQNEIYEQFDIDSYQKLMSLLTKPALLMNPQEEFWDNVLLSLFVSSFLYELPRFQSGSSTPVIPSASKKSADILNPQAALDYIMNNTFFGSTNKLVLKPRPNIAYMSISAIASLASLSESLFLAKQYITLRAAVVLYQYISDHPLRGDLIPMPKVQRHELLFILDLDKDHLAQVNGLIIKAIPVARNDPLVLTKCSKLLPIL